MAGQILGIVNRNVLNIKNSDNSDPWFGSIGVDEHGHCIFSHEMWSVRAWLKIMLAKQRAGKTTLAQIIADYTDVVEDQEAYLQFIFHQTTIKAGEKLNLFFGDGTLRFPANAELLCRSMAQFECFTGYYLPDDAWTSGMGAFKNSNIGSK